MFRVEVRPPWWLAGLFIFGICVFAAAKISIKIVFILLRLIYLVFNRTLKTCRRADFRSTA